MQTRQETNIRRTSSLLWKFLFALALLMTFPFSLIRAQQPAGAGTNSTTQLPDSPQPQDKQSPGGVVGTTSTFVGYMTNRSFFFPDIATSPGPISSGQKFELFLNESIAPSSILTSSISAGFGQARNSPAAYGQGASGYFDRFGASMARGASNSFFGTYILASVLHQDPRYFPHSHPTFWGTVKHATTRIVVTRTDSGNYTFNSSYLVGVLGGETLANTYLPRSEQTGAKTLERFGSDIGWHIAGNFFKEYWPTLFKSLGLKSLKVIPDPGPVQ